MAPTLAMDSFVFDGRGRRANVGDDGFNGLVNAALDREGRGARRDDAQTFAHNRLRQHGGGRGAVARDIVGLGGDFFDQFRADIFRRIGQLDLFGDGDAVLGDGRRAEFLLDNHVATLGAECHFHRVGDFVHAALKAATGLFIKSNVFCHDVFSLGGRRDTVCRVRLRRGLTGSDISKPCPYGCG